MPGTTLEGEKEERERGRGRKRERERERERERADITDEPLKIEVHMYNFGQLKSSECTVITGESQQCQECNMQDTHAQKQEIHKCSGL